MPAPADIIQFSPNHRYEIVLRIASRKGFVCTAASEPGGKRRMIWWFRGWSQFAYVSDDGRCVALTDSNLLDLDYKPSDALITFYAPHTRPHAVSIADALGEHPELTRTVSHYSWGEYLGFDPANNFLLRTDQGRILRIHPI